MKKTSKIAIVGLMLTMIWPLAGQAAPTNSTFNGFYLGAMGDMAYTSAKLTGDYTWGGTPETVKVRAGGYNFGGGLLGGYGRVFGSIYLGAGLFANYVPSDRTTVVGQESGLTWKEGRLKANFSFGGVLRGGYLVTPTVMIYGLLGVVDTHFDFSGVYEQGRWQNHASKNMVGFMPGIGMATFLSQHLMLQVQYAQELYSSLTTNTATWMDGPDVVTNRTKANPSRGVFSLIFSYAIG